MRRSTLFFVCALLCPLAVQADQTVFEASAAGDHAVAQTLAKQTGDGLVIAYAEWAYLRDPAAPPIPFDDGYAFLLNHPDWPDQSAIRLRTEEAALDTHPDKSALRSFCTTPPPISGRGMIACAMVGAGSEEQRAQWIHQGWRQGAFSDSEESLIMNNYGHMLTESDQVARMDRLLYEERLVEAKRMLPYVPRDRQTLYMARMALQSSAKDVTFRLNAVPVNLAHDPGLLFDRIRWHHHKDEDDQVLALFQQAPQDPPYADSWWPLRAITVRDALSHGKYSIAVHILAAQGDLKPEYRAEALFLKGWIALQYLHDPLNAYKDFFALYTESQTPMSKARAAYWAAEAATQNGNADIAASWREKAAQRPTVFYGQMAFEELHPNTPLPLPQEPAISAGEESRFLNEDLVRVTKMLAENDQKPMADHFLAHLATTSDEPSRFVLLARFARAIGQPEGAVKVAKIALKKGTVLAREGWPVMTVPKSGIEPALVLSIVRQESEFDPEALSPAGARGLMQLVPGTAALVAKHTGLPYDGRTLDNPQGNVALGSEYLAHLVDVMDDSYVLAIAAYNAGPGRVHQWQTQYGGLKPDPRYVVDWIENIPYSETRNYVMRAMENVGIYRALLKQDQPLQLREDLVRGTK